MHHPLSRAALHSLTVLVLGLVLLIAALVSSRAETRPATPFGVPVQGAAPSAFAPQAAAPLQARGPFGKLLSWVADTQQSMQRELATGVKRLKSGNAIGAILALAGLSFLYGVVHAVGPGHGKAIISSYVVANEETVRRGIMISFIAAALQALAAILLVSVLLIGLNATGLQINSWANQLESVSYAMIALVGLYLLTTQSVRLWRSYREGSSAQAAKSQAASRRSPLRLSRRRRRARGEGGRLSHFDSAAMVMGRAERPGFAFSIPADPLVAQSTCQSQWRYENDFSFPPS